MPDILAAGVEYGGYISIVKLLVFIAMFYAWMPLVNWVHTDCQSVRTKVMFWTRIIAALGAFALVLWLLVPLFWIGFPVYLISIGTMISVYILHRNSLVADFERVLTVDHIKSLFVNEEKKMAKASKGISLITANGNEVPFPKPKSPEAMGFALVCEVFEDAAWRRASEVVFQPAGDEYSVVYRIDGFASKRDPREREEMEHFTHFIKQLADLNVKERRKPQKGNFTLQKGDDKFKWEVRTAGSTAGEQVLAKRLEAFNIMRTTDIGFEVEQIEIVAKNCDLKKGLFIISGPKKSGVTSTLYAMLKNHDPFMNDINTLEKRPAGEVENITQHHYTMSDSGTMSYDKRLRSIARMGPNIMGVGDCDDAKTAGECIRALKEDKLIYVTTEASSVATALGRWFKYIPDREIVVDNLIGICNQRLIRKLCNECKQAYTPNPKLVKKFGLVPEKSKILHREGEIEYDKHGNPLLCEMCQGTSFYGRTGVFELIMFDDALKASVKSAKSLQEIAVLFRRSGMRYLQEQAMLKVTDGTTSINEVVREFSTGKKKSASKKEK